mgnify:CR=1 FL=1
MKKIVITVLVAIIIIIGILFIVNSTRNINEVLAKYENYESDGYSE